MVIPNDTRQYFWRPIASEGQLGTMPPKWKFCHPICGTCALKTSETTFRQNRGVHLFGGWTLLWTHQNYLQRSSDPRLMKRGPCPFPKNPNPAHGPSGLWSMDQRLL